MTELALLFGILFAFILGAVIGIYLGYLSLRSAGLKLVPQMYEEPKATDDDGYLICEDAERIKIDEETFEQIYKEMKERYKHETDV